MLPIKCQKNKIWWFFRNVQNFEKKNIYNLTPEGGPSSSVFEWTHVVVGLLTSVSLLCWVRLSNIVGLLFEDILCIINIDFVGKQVSYNLLLFKQQNCSADKLKKTNRKMKNKKTVMMTTQRKRGESKLEWIRGKMKGVKIGWTIKKRQQQETLMDVIKRRKKFNRFIELLFGFSWHEIWVCNIVGIRQP